MIHNNVPGGGHDQHLQGIAGGHIDEHSHKFQTDHNGQCGNQKLQNVQDLAVEMLNLPTSCLSRGGLLLMRVPPRM